MPQIAEYQRGFRRWGKVSTFVSGLGAAEAAPSQNLRAVVLLTASLFQFGVQVHAPAGDIQSLAPIAKSLSLDHDMV